MDVKAIIVKHFFISFRCYFHQDMARLGFKGFVCHGNRRRVKANAPSSQAFLVTNPLMQPLRNLLDAHFQHGRSFKF